MDIHPKSVAQVVMILKVTLVHNLNKVIHLQCLLKLEHTDKGKDVSKNHL